jgi:hypothetical protein
MWSATSCKFPTQKMKITGRARNTAQTGTLLIFIHGGG